MRRRLLRSPLPILALLALLTARGDAQSAADTPLITMPVVAGQTFTISQPGTIQVYGDRIVILYGPPVPLPPGPDPTPPPPVPVSTIPPAWKGDLFVLAFFDKTLTLTADQQAVQASTTMAPALVGVAPTVKTTWVPTDVSSPMYARWRPDPAKFPPPSLVVIATNAAGVNLGFETLGLPTPEAAVVAEVKRIRGVP